MRTRSRKSNTLTSVNTRAGKENRYKQYAISLYVSNKPGVLIRIALVFARRGYNIDSLAVSSANDPSFSWMHIVASGDEGTLDQILRQLEKLVDVIKAEPHVYDNALERELALVKIRASLKERTQILEIAHALTCRIADVSETTITLELAGSPGKIDTLHAMVAEFDILEFIRTGKIMLPRGEEAGVGTAGGR
ncbi:MAG TPA: acetolactate synthase small subunit [Spirochaetia bacterium]|nr:acetolactate synthase small subunit [Spirochaetia bacterium]